MNGAKDGLDAWYVKDGADNDVVLSSRVRLARNLTGFAFPSKIKSDDAERVLSLVFDAFIRSAHPEQYQMIRLSGIDAIGRRILSERGLIDPLCGIEPWRGIILKNDGIFSVAVNTKDHVRLSAFSSGLSVQECAKIVFEGEKELSSSLQFSAMKDFGYLSSNVLSSGSGMKVSILLSLQGITMSGVLDRIMRDFLSTGFTIQGYYATEGNGSLGFLYRLSNLSSLEGNAETQLAGMLSAAKKLVELERKSRKELMIAKPTIVEDSVYRAIVTAKYARFISFNEGVDLLQRIKLGLALGLITGTTDTELSALLYRIQNAHIHFVILSGNVIIEEDIVTEDGRMDRLRAMVIQEVLKKTDIREYRG